MAELPSRAAPAAHAGESSPRCRYCGAPLNAFFYFCVGCGTPYKDLDSVVVRSRPRELSEGERIQMKAPGVWPLFWSYLGVAVGTAVLSALLFDRDDPAVVLVLHSIVFFVTTCIFASLHWRTLVSQLRRLGFLQREAWLALGLLGPFLLLNYAYSRFIAELAGDGATIQKAFEGVDPAMLLITVCILPAIVEEIAFRGLVQHWLHTALRPWRAIVLSSALFVALHFNVFGAPYLFLLGGLLGYAKWKTKSLYPSMLIHFLHNYVVVFYL